MSDDTRESTTQYRADDGREATIEVFAPLDTLGARYLARARGEVFGRAGFDTPDAALSDGLREVRRLLGDDGLSRESRPVARRALTEK